MKTHNQVLKGSYVGYLNGMPLCIPHITDLGYIVSGFLMQGMPDGANRLEQEFVFMRTSLFRQRIDQLTPVGMEVIHGNHTSRDVYVDVLNKLYGYRRSRNLAAAKILIQMDYLGITVTISYFFRKEEW